MHHLHVSNTITGCNPAHADAPRSSIVFHISSGSSTVYAARSLQHEVAKIVPLWRLLSELPHAYAMPYLMRVLLHAGCSRACSWRPGRGLVG